jgi:RNA polymerase sigma-54 factor
MQSIRLLQLSHIELDAFIEAELLRNPLLEREDAEGGEAEPEAPAPAESDFEDTVAHTERIQSADGIADGLDTAVENVFPEQVGQDSPDRTDMRPLAGNGQEGGEAPDLDQYVAARLSLADHLAAQVNMLLRTGADRLIARALIDNLDEAGYLRTELAAIAGMLGAEIEDVEEVLLAVQGCDPVGVFARDLAECLAIQLRDKDRFDPLMARLVDNLPLIASHDMAGLARIVGCDREDLADMLAELRLLDPRPGRAFDGAPVETVVPDVFVRRAPAGGWAVELNSDILPRVLVNRTYYAEVSGKARDAAEKGFLSDCHATANWLTRSLDQRAQTIVKVASEIVRQQEGFLTHGVSHLRPMTLKLVADAIDMHESTVSRVTANKYMATPRGLFEMKYFFTTALASTSGGDEHSAEAVRHRIKQLIEAEPPAAILSDDTIADMLKREQGIDVARRTVAKYREAMNIPSSVVRRRQKQAMAARG